MFKKFCLGMRKKLLGMFYYNFEFLSLFLAHLPSAVLCWKLDLYLWQLQLIFPLLCYRPSWVLIMPTFTLAVTLEVYFIHPGLTLYMHFP